MVNAAVHAQVVLLTTGPIASTPCLTTGDMVGNIPSIFTARIAGGICGARGPGLQGRSPTLAPVAPTTTNLSKRFGIQLQAQKSAAAPSPRAVLASVPADSVLVRSEYNQYFQTTQIILFLFIITPFKLLLIIRLCTAPTEFYVTPILFHVYFSKMCTFKVEKYSKKHLILIMVYGFTG